MNQETRRKILELLNLVEEVIDNGDWPTDNDYVAELVVDIRTDFEEV